MDLIAKTMIKRIVEKGVEISTIPSFIRNLANILVIDSGLGLQELNLRLSSLGWDDIELDDHTLQLIIAFFEANDLIGLKAGMTPIFENLFNQENSPYKL